MSRGRPLRIVGVADSDSYVKWAAALLSAAPREWRRELVVLDTTLTVSAAQLSAALAGTAFPAESVARTTLAALERRLRSDPPDVVLLASRGPVVRLLARSVSGVSPRPVIVSGLPGISIPATPAAVVYRAQADLFVVHSHREVRDFTAVSDRAAIPQRYGLAGLPFATRAASAHGGGDLVFAAQALVPRRSADRRRIAALLVSAAAADPARRVVVKLRAAQGEQQTHPEKDAFPELIAALGPVPPNLVVSTEPMRDALDRAQGLVTVSSTAAIEAIARGVPIIALDVFGVSDALINTVFQSSGLFGGEDDVIARRFRRPQSGWLRDNYLHDRDDDDWAERVEELVALRREGTLAPRPPLPRPGRALRDAWDRQTIFGTRGLSPVEVAAVAVGVPLRAIARGVTRARR